MKRILLLVLILTLAFFIPGCNKEAVPDHDSREAQQQEEPGPQEEPEEDPEKEPEPQKTQAIPVLEIKTPGWRMPRPEDDFWIEDATFVIRDSDSTVTEIGTGKIKVRGNSSRWFPKRPYNISLDEKSVLLGMPSSKKWCLLSNWMDRTLLRNAVAFEISRRTSLSWTPRGRYVELVFNGTALGNYFLCEKIKIARNRVNISDENGYIVELDTYFDEVNRFHSQYFNYPVMFKEPDEDSMTEEKFKFFEDSFNEVERVLAGGAASGEYRDLLDIDSFIDYWFVEELTENGECWHPKSTYMYKDGEDRIFAGPVWDFDWATFRPGVRGFCIAGALWYGKLFEDPFFRSRVVQKWREEVDGFRSVADYIDTTAAYIRDSAIKNGKQWPINQNVCGDERLSFDAAVARMRSAYVARVNEMDRLISSME